VKHNIHIPGEAAYQVPVSNISIDDAHRGIAACAFEIAEISATEVVQNRDVGRAFDEKCIDQV
jgi:hypothetical protein